MTAVALTIQGGHGYAEHGRIRATVAGTTKPLRADGTVTFDVPAGVPSIAIDVTVRRPPWATAHGFAEDDLETAHVDLHLQGKQYGIRWPMHPRLVVDRGATRGGAAVEVIVDYRFIDVTRYYMRGEVYAAKHPETRERPTLLGLDPATNAEKPGVDSQPRPASLSVRFCEWTTRRGCRLWCVAFPWNVRWSSPLDWFLFLVPKGPTKRASTLLDHDFKVARRYLLDPPRWAPRFLWAPVNNPSLKEDLVDFDSPIAHQVFLNDPHPPAALLTQASRASRPTVLVAPLPDDQSNERYQSIVNPLLLETDLIALRTGIFASGGQVHLGGWAGGERFGCAGFSASALHPFDIARVVADRVAKNAGSPDLTLIGLIDPPGFTFHTSQALAGWQRSRANRSCLIVGGDHHEKIHAEARKGGGGVEIHPPSPDHFAYDPNEFARALFTPPVAERWSAAPLTEATDAEISAAREGHAVLAVAKGSTSDLVGWIRGSGAGRPLYSLGLVPVPMTPSLQEGLTRLSTMEISSYIGWWDQQPSPPRKPATDLAAFLRKSSDLRHQWAVASGDVLTQILARWR